MAERYLKSPQSKSGTSPHPTVVTQGWGPGSWMIDWHPFYSMSISLPIHEIRLFQTFNLKIKCQGYGWVRRTRSHIRLSIRQLIFCFTSIRPLFLEIQPQDYFRVLGVRLRLVKFDLEKYRAKFISEVKDWGHITDPVSSWCLSFSFHIQWTKYDQECLTFMTYRILRNDSPNFFFYIFQWLHQWCYHANKQTYVHQYHSHDLGSGSCKSHPVCFLRPVCSLSHNLRYNANGFHMSSKKSLRQW